MNQPVALNDSMTWVGVNDRTTDLFEAIWPLPHGVSYNSYLVRGSEKVALMDTVRDNYFGGLYARLQKVLDEDEKPDYVVLHHLEPDHSGSIVKLRRQYPEATVLCSEKAAEYLDQAFGISENVRAVGDGDTVDLGGPTLQFHLTPMIHWPETMMTWVPQTGTLFSGDAFGSFASLDGGIFDDQIDTDALEPEILRYFSNIVGKYAQMVTRALKKLSDLDIKTVAPLHGPVWRSNPAHIIELYRRWSNHEAEKGATVVYCSMYNNTRRMMENVLCGLKENGLTRVNVHDASRRHVSYMLRDCWKNKGLIFGSPTHDTTIMPPLHPLVDLLQNKKLQNRVTGVFGSCGWAGGAVDELREMAEDLDWHLTRPVIEANFAPTDEQLKQCRELGRQVAENIMSD